MSCTGIYRSCERKRQNIQLIMRCTRIPINDDVKAQYFEHGSRGVNEIVHLRNFQDAEKTYSLLRVFAGFAKQYQVFKEKDMSSGLPSPSPFPHLELGLSQQLALFLQVNLRRELTISHENASL